MSFVCSTNGVRPARSTTLKENFLSREERTEKTFTSSPSPFPLNIIAIPLESINELESSNVIPYVALVGNNLESCFLEKGKLLIKPSSAYSKAIINYSILCVENNNINTGSVIAEMKREGSYFTHELKEGASMNATIYLS